MKADAAATCAAPAMKVDIPSSALRKGQAGSTFMAQAPFYQLGRQAEGGEDEQACRKISRFCTLNWSTV